MRSLLAKLLVLAAAALGLGARASDLVLTGVLIDTRGQSLPGSVVFVAPLDPGGRAFVELDGDKVLNPRATTDAVGRFSVAVPAEFAARAASLTVGLAEAAPGTPAGPSQVPLVPVRRHGRPARVEPGAGVVDLGAVTSMGGP
jgi:hypothetical protein